MIYQNFQAYTDSVAPLRCFANMAAAGLAHPLPGISRNAVHRAVAALYELIARAGLSHRRPAFGIDQVEIAGRPVAVREVAVHRTPFCTLLRFEKDIPAPQPRVLLVAPMSGHFATLLRGTVRTMLSEHDVYITDWHNARDIGLQTRPLRLRRLHRACHHFPRGAGSRRAYRRGLPALRRGAGGGRDHGRRRPSGAAAQHDPDGGPDRYPGQPDRGQSAGDEPADRLVRAQPDRYRPMAL